MRPRLVDVTLAALVFVLLIEWVYQSTLSNWDIDINHMLYFGARFLENEFHWTREFDDKLPVLQFIFAIPAAFDSIGIWRSMSLFSIVLGMSATWYLTYRILSQDDSLARSERYRLGALSAVGTGYFFTFLPGGIHHINPMSSSLAIASLAAWLASRDYFVRTLPVSAAFATSAIFASLSIGIRPYFLFPLIVGAVWIATRGKDKSDRVLPIFSKVVLWVSLVGLFGLLVNALPYLIAGRLDVFFAGMEMLSQKLNPKGLATTVSLIWDSIAAMKFPLFIIFLCCAASAIVSCLVLLSNFRRSRGALAQDLGIPLDTVFICLVIPALLLTSIVSRHFWPHYLQMFGPFFAVGFPLIFYFAFFSDRQQTLSLDQVRRAFFISVIAVFALPSMGMDLVRLLRHEKASDFDVVVEAVEATLNDLPKERRDFLFVSGRGSMYAHWRLSEPRYGFPHASNSSQIFDGWWTRLKMPAHFAHPVNADEYCVEVFDKGPSVLFVSDKLAALQNCLSAQDQYASIGSLSSGNVAVYLRN